MRYKLQEEMQKLHQLRENTGLLEVIETDDRVILVSDIIPVEELTVFLEQNNFAYGVTEDGVEVYDPIDEVLEELEEYELDPVSASDLMEASAKRKVVIRKGKRKIIFKCSPGQKKIGRRCAKKIF